MKSNLRIALYQPWIYQKGGMERVILEMTGEKSRHHWTIYTNHYSPQTTFPEFSKRKVVELNRVPVQRGTLSLIKAASKIAMQKIDLSQFDALLVSTGGFGEFIMLKNHSKPAVCFCHTPLRVVHDPTAKKEAMKGSLKTMASIYAFARIYATLEKTVWKHFSFVAANSLETKKRIVNSGLFPAEKVSVIHPGVDLGKVKPSTKFGDYFLLPGRISPLKNIELAIDSFKQFEAKTPKFRLVIAGAPGEKDAAYFQKLKESASSTNNIQFVLSPTEKQLLSLYDGCYCVLFTALNEDWGIVPVEAMAHGKPVITVNQGGPIESVMDAKTGILCEPNTKDFTKAMVLLARHPLVLHLMARNCVKQAKSFDNRIFSKSIDELVQKACLPEKNQP